MPASEPKLQVTPKPSSRRRAIASPQVLGISNWTKQERGSTGPTAMLGCETRLRSMAKLAYSCPRPAQVADAAEEAAPSSSELADPSSAASAMAARRQAAEVRTAPRRKNPRAMAEEMDMAREDSCSDPAIAAPVPAGSRIMVYVRMRPMAKAEKEAGARSCVRVVNKRDVYLTEFASETDYLRLKRLKGRHFVFDAAFPDATGQQEVYNVSAAELVEGVLQGRNGSVFCYGATGAGKTHTMLGTTSSPGVMVLALKDLFTKLQQRCGDRDFVVRLSYLEVYNESVRDLLSPGRPLVLREDSKQGIIAAGLTQYEAYSADEIMSLLHRGNQNRTTEPTRANETSSRSHAILQVSVEYKVKHDSHYICRTGKLSLIDLAGSERALATDQRTIRSLEGANINRSLLALSSCINALVEGKKHIPFRNSKLTQLLKDSLGGGCQTSMIANISPSNTSFGETQNTLHWADRAKQIRTKVCAANEEIQVPETEADQAKLLLEVQRENQQLRMQLARMQQKLLSMESSAIMVARQSPALITPTATPTHNHHHNQHHHHQQQQQQLSSVICRTPVSEMKMAAARHEECRAVEEALRRRMRELEDERDDALRDLAAREAKLASSMALLQRDHSLQIRHKDDFIRSLCGVVTATQPKRNHVVQETTTSDEVDDDCDEGGAIEGEKEFRYHPRGLASSSTINAVDKVRNAPDNLSVAAAAAARRRMTMGEGAVSNNTNGVVGIGSARRMSIASAAAPAPAPPATMATSKKPGVKRPAMPATPTSSVRTRRTRLLEAEENLSIAQQGRNKHTEMAGSAAGGGAPRRQSSRIPQPPAPPAPALKTPLNNNTRAMTTMAMAMAGCKDGTDCGIKKRTFWDITNASSPSATAPVSRCTRSNTCATPSMLLQPGFLGGAGGRRRLLQ